VDDDLIAPRHLSLSHAPAPPAGVRQAARQLWARRPRRARRLCRRWRRRRLWRWRLWLWLWRRNRRIRRCGRRLGRGRGWQRRRRCRRRATRWAPGWRWLFTGSGSGRGRHWRGSGSGLNDQNLPDLQIRRIQAWVVAQKLVERDVVGARNLQRRVAGLYGVGDHTHQHHRRRRLGSRRRRGRLGRRRRVSRGDGR
jgi:hypothetical protein